MKKEKQKLEAAVSLGRRGGQATYKSHGKKQMSEMSKKRWSKVKR